MFTFTVTSPALLASVVDVATIRRLGWLTRAFVGLTITTWTGREVAPLPKFKERGLGEKVNCQSAGVPSRRRGSGRFPGLRTRLGRATESPAGIPGGWPSPRHVGP